MIYKSKKLFNDDDIILENVLNTGEYNIIFGTFESVDESYLISSDDKSTNVLIRNRIRDGKNGKPIQHPECTVKMIKKDFPKVNGSKGLPFSVETLELYKTANTDRNKKLYKKKDYNFLKKVIEDNRNDIIRYWNADPNTKEGLRTIEAIEDGFEIKYIRKK